MRAAGRERSAFPRRRLRGKVVEPVLPRLPPELWSSIFGYLPVTDKLSVRACCKLFQELVDHESLWKDWTVVLSMSRWPCYNKRFWETLRRRNVRSAVVSSIYVEEWKELAWNLPGLTTLIVLMATYEWWECLGDFPNLKRLSWRGQYNFLLGFPGFPEFVAEQLTYLSLCGTMYSFLKEHEVMSVISQFRNLESLICHRSGIIVDPFWLLEAILACLPKLKHLSFIGDTALCSHYIDGPRQGPPAGPYSRVLSSLEVLQFADVLFSDDLMRFLPGLKSLSIFYKYSYHDCPYLWSSAYCPLKLWLDDLPQLSSLLIVQGPPIETYLTSIPATLTSLTLCVAGLTSENMAAIAERVPNLLHLHIDPWPACFRAYIGEIPQLFPKLRSLKISHKYLPEDAFFRLHHLHDLEYLEIMDGESCFSELAEELRALTNYRLQIKLCLCWRDALSCRCFFIKRYT